MPTCSCGREKQIATFVDTWYHAVERNAIVGPIEREPAAEKKGRIQRAQTRATELKAALAENAGLRRLAVNPMLLSIIALLHRTQTTLPRERRKLYGNCSQILLEQWDIERGVHVDDTKLTLQQKEMIMRRLAVAMHRGEIGAKDGARDATASDVLAVIANVLPSFGRQQSEAPYLLKKLIERSGIIVERQRDVIGFGHHTFQEYFTAQSIHLSEELGDREYLAAPERLLSDWWREVILLYVGHLTDASAFIAQVYDPVEQDLFLPRLRLAALCLNEAVAVKKEVVRIAIWNAVLAVRCGNESAQFVAYHDEVLEYLLRWLRGHEWYGAAAVTFCKRFPKSTDVIEAGLTSALHSTPELQVAAVTCLPHVDGDLFDRLWPTTAAVFEACDHDLSRPSIPPEVSVAVWGRALTRRVADPLLMSVQFTRFGEDFRDEVLAVVTKITQWPEQDDSLFVPAISDAVAWLVEQGSDGERILLEWVPRSPLALSSLQFRIGLANSREARIYMKLGHDLNRAIYDAALDSLLKSRDREWGQILATNPVLASRFESRIMPRLQAQDEAETRLILEQLAAMQPPVSERLCQIVLELATSPSPAIAAGAIAALPLLIGTDHEASAVALLVDAAKSATSLRGLAAIQAAPAFVKTAAGKQARDILSRALRSSRLVLRAYAMDGIASSNGGICDPDIYPLILLNSHRKTRFLRYGDRRHLLHIEFFSAWTVAAAMGVPKESFAALLRQLERGRVLSGGHFWGDRGWRALWERTHPSIKGELDLEFSRFVESNVLTLCEQVPPAVALEILTSYPENTYFRDVLCRLAESERVRTE